MPHERRRAKPAQTPHNVKLTVVDEAFAPSFKVGSGSALTAEQGGRLDILYSGAASGTDNFIRAKLTRGNIN